MVNVLDYINAMNRRHFAQIAQLATRDVPLQLATGFFLCAICFQLGHKSIAIMVAVLTLIHEVCLIRIFKRRAPFVALSKEQAALLALVLSTLNTFLYLIPALYLAADPSLAMKITAILWVIGAQVYINNTWSGVPSFLYGMLLPAMLMMVIVFFQLPKSAPVASSLAHWSVTFAFVVIFLYSSIDTLRQHMDMQSALVDAEQTASQRLLQLEESQRLDSLTGLLNRTAFDTALHVMLQDRASGGGEIAVFLVDLDAFKPINDTYSHDAGDEVLLETARRLKAHVSDMGIVGRLGGDEFICAVQDLVDATDARDYARALTAVMARPIEWSGRKLKIAASVGIAMTGDGPPSPLATVPALCSAADQAMFASKTSANRGPVMFDSFEFAPRMTANDKQILIDGITNQTVKPFYQPKVHLPTGKIIGFEALARWDHPDLGTRYPDDFIKHINELGLQGDFMTSISTQVMHDINLMLDMGLDPGQVSLNVPEVALATHTGSQDLQTIIADNPDAARHLTLEITEDVFIARAADTIQASIAAFRDLGVRISLDDFGTGFASFHHLRQLDFDELKIDTSFVAGLGHDPTSDVLVRGFLDIASGLGVSVIAEGVETDAQSIELINMGCIIAQGYLFSAAVPLTRAMDLLRDTETT